MKRFLTFEELKDFRPKKDTYFVFGDPIEHSLSPNLHDSYFSLAHLDGNYLAVRVSPNRLEEAINCVKGYAGGVNLTIPLKEAVFPFLTEIDPAARIIGAVNTLSFDGGKIKGYNTDCDGVLLALSSQGISLKGKRVLILGNGGAAKAMLAAALLSTKQITVAGRNLEKVTAFCEGTVATPALLSEIDGKYDVVLNATSAGMGAQMCASPLNVSQIKNCNFLFDSIYNPFHTNFLTLGKAMGVPGINGLRMLVYQGLKAQQIWGNPVEDSFGDRIVSTLETAMTNRKKNLILIGYMGSGKTTVGKEISKRTGMPFFDTDQLLEEKFSQSVSEMFETHGEDWFRKQETELYRQLSFLNGCVIATGGGVVKNPRNIRFLKENGQVFFLNPPFLELQKRLEADTTRPLLRNSGRMKTIYDERLPSYQSSADAVIQSIGVSESAGEILEIFTP